MPFGEINFHNTGKKKAAFAAKFVMEKGVRRKVLRELAIFYNFPYIKNI